MPLTQWQYCHWAPKQGLRVIAPRCNDTLTYIENQCGTLTPTPKVKELADAWQRWNRELAKPLWAPGRGGGG